MSDVDLDLAAFLGEHAPFDALDESARTTLADAAEISTYASGDVVVDAFVEPTTEVFVVLSGHVDLWHHPQAHGALADDRLGAGGVFGYSAMLSGRSVGPRAVAVGATTIARIGSDAVAPAFSSARGVRFVAQNPPQLPREAAAAPAYGVVDELIRSEPVEVQPTTSVADVARLMTERGATYAAVTHGDGTFGIVTDALLRKHIVVDGRSTATPAAEIERYPSPTARLGESSAEALILLLDSPDDCLLVTDRAGALRGAIDASDFIVSPATAGVALREQITRAGSIDDLVELGSRVPGLLADLLSRGMASGRVITVHSATIDAIVRRALRLVFDERPDLSIDAFTWLSLGSNGRREAVPSSDVDSAVAFAESVTESEQSEYRAAFAAVDDVISRAGFSIDSHGATARREPFSRTNSAWRAAARQWLDAPEENQGAIMTSLLVDGRPIHGDPGLPTVTRVFGALRRHQGTMRLLLSESLSAKARLRSMRDVLGGRAGTFDIKAHALVPVINIARWAALSVGSKELSTPERLRAASGSQMLPDDQATTLIEVYEVLQRVRLRYQIAQRSRGDKPSDVLSMHTLSPIDRSVIGQAVREVSTIQKRMANVSQYVPTDEWADSPATKR